MAGMAAPPVIPLTKIIKSHSIRSSRRHQRHKVHSPLLRMFDAHAMLGQQCGSSDMLVCCLSSCIGTSAEIQEESLQLLDWPAVCSQVACFASTALAADQILQHGLPMGMSKVTLASILCLTIFRSSNCSSPYTAPPMALASQRGHSGMLNEAQCKWAEASESMQVAPSKMRMAIQTSRRS